MKAIAAKITQIEVCILVAVILAFSFGTTGEAAENGELVLYLSLDEGSGDKVEDRSNNGNDGIVNNCEWVEGKFGSALEFEGTAESFVEVPGSDTLSSWEALTVSVWVKLASFANNWGRIIDKDGDPPSGTGFWMANRDGGAVSAGFWNQPSVGNYIDFTQTKIEQDEWTHLAFVWEELGDFTVYFNGKKDGLVMTKDTPCNTRADVPLFLGKPSEAEEASVLIECYAGLIDELAIYNYALSEDEIAKAMDGQLPGVAVEAVGKLVAMWGAIKGDPKSYQKGL